MNRRLQIFSFLLGVCSLVSCGKEPTPDTTQWKKSLVTAIRRNDTEAMGRILSANSLSVDVALNGNKLTPLIVASSEGSMAVVQWLLDHGAKVNAGTEKENGTALLGACTHGRVNVARLLLERGANIHHQDNRGWSPLMGAIETTNTQVAELLLERGADANASFSNGRSTLMMCASTADDPFLLRLLIEKGAKVNQVSKDGDHALLEAATGGKAATVPVLLQSGAQIDLQNKEGWTALIKAAAHGHCQVVKALCDAGANPTLTNKFGRTALNYARGIAGTNGIIKVRDITAAAEKGLIDRDEAYYVTIRNGSGRDYDCIIKTLEAHEKAFGDKTSAPSRQ